MSIVTRDPQRAALKFRRVTRHSWGPNPQRVVVVTLIESGDVTTASVWGAEGVNAVELEHVEGAAIRKQSGPVVIDLPGGALWTLGGVSCSCNVPAALKAFSPLRHVEPTP